MIHIVVLLFGAKKIPELAKGFGKGIKNFKEEMKEVDEVTVDEPLIELVVKCVEETDFIRTKASDKLKSIVDKRK